MGLADTPLTVPRSGPLVVLAVALILVSGCGRESVARSQALDRLVYRQVLTSLSSPPVRLPAGRYTISSGAQSLPNGCGGSALSLQGPSGRLADVGIGQHDLVAGEYTVSLANPDGKRPCAWKLQVVMNRPHPGDSPPPEFPVHSPAIIRAAGTGTGSIHVPASGNYQVDASITEDSGACPSALSLTGPQGLALRPTLPRKGDQESRSELLVEGDWAIASEPGCHWILVLSPLFGRGGGASNF